MDGVCDDDLCWLQLDDFRMLLIKHIDPSRITPYLRQCQVIFLHRPPFCASPPVVCSSFLILPCGRIGIFVDVVSSLSGDHCWRRRAALQWSNPCSQETKSWYVVIKGIMVKSKAGDVRCTKWLYVKCCDFWKEHWGIQQPHYLTSRHTVKWQLETLTIQLFLYMKVQN